MYTNQTEGGETSQFLMMTRYLAITIELNADIEQGYVKFQLRRNESSRSAVRFRYSLGVV